MDVASQSQQHQQDDENRHHEGDEASGRAIPKHSFSSLAELPNESFWTQDSENLSFKPAVSLPRLQKIIFLVLHSSEICISLNTYRWLRRNGHRCYSDWNKLSANHAYQSWF